MQMRVQRQRRNRQAGELLPRLERTFRLVESDPAQWEAWRAQMRPRVTAGLRKRLPLRLRNLLASV